MCLYGCVSECPCVCLSVCLCACLSVSPCVRVSRTRESVCAPCFEYSYIQLSRISVSVSLCVSLCVCQCACLSVSVCVSVCVRVCLCGSVWVCVRTLGRQGQQSGGATLKRSQRHSDYRVMSPNTDDEFDTHFPIEDLTCASCHKSVRPLNCQRQKP